MVPYIVCVLLYVRLVQYIWVVHYRYRKDWKERVCKNEKICQTLEHFRKIRNLNRGSMIGLWNNNSTKRINYFSISLHCKVILQFHNLSNVWMKRNHKLWEKNEQTIISYCVVNIFILFVYLFLICCTGTVLYSIMYVFLFYLNLLL